MNYIADMKIIVFFGGRNDKNFQLAGSFNLNDISVLSVNEQLIWTNVQIVGNIPSPRYSHCSAIIEDCLIIFGGIKDSGYCTSELCILELNQDEAAKIKKEEDKKRRRDIIIMGKVLLTYVTRICKGILARKGLSKLISKKVLHFKD